MSNVIIGIVALVLFIGMALAGALFLGPRFSNSRTDAQAARYMSEGSQISKAYDMFALNQGSYPDGTGYTGSDQTQAILNQLVQTGYLKSIPVGGNGDGLASSPWYIDTTNGAALTMVGTGDGTATDTSAGAKICQAERTKAGFSDTVHDCGDSAMLNNDPCCTSAS